MISDKSPPGTYENRCLHVPGGLLSFYFKVYSSVMPAFSQASTVS